MFISVSKVNDRYSFVVGESPKDPPEAYFDSFFDFDLVSGISSTYDTYGEAHLNGLKLVSSVPSAILAKKAHISTEPDAESSPEDRVVGHFSRQADLMAKRLSAMESEPSEDRQAAAEAFMKEVSAIEDSIKSLLGEVDNGSNKEELEDLLADIGSMKSRAAVMAPDKPGVKTASVKKSDPIPVLISFAEAAMKSITPSHRTAHVRLIEEDEESDSYFIHLSEEGGDICSLKFNGDLLLTGIVPSKRLSMVHPYHSTGFMEKYWEPITSGVGHFLLPGKNILVSHYHPESTRRNLAGVKLDDRSECSVSLLCKDGSWWLEDKELHARKEASASSPSLYLNKEVRCIKKNLPTYYGRTGSVLRVTPRSDYTELTVDFRRGLGTLVLKEEDIEPLPV